MNTSRLIPSLLLAAVLCQAAEPALNNPNVVRSITGAEGTWEWIITPEQADASPLWFPDPRREPPYDILEAPLSPAAAIRKAREHLATQFPKVAIFSLRAYSCRRLTPYILNDSSYSRDRWYYTIEHEAASETLRSRNAYTVIMLLDGTIIEPRITPPKAAQ